MKSLQILEFEVVKISENVDQISYAIIIDDSNNVQQLEEIFLMPVPSSTQHSIVAEAMRLADISDIPEEIRRGRGRPQADIEESKKKAAALAVAGNTLQLKKAKNNISSIMYRRKTNQKKLKLIETLQLEELKNQNLITKHQKNEFRLKQIKDLMASLGISVP